MDVNFELYRSFIAIYKSGTLSNAARIRFMTQPAMSQHLAVLESTIGEALFIRESRKMLPTKKGIELYTKIVSAVEKLEDISLTLSHQETHKLNIGAPREYFEHAVLKKIAQSKLSITVSFGETEELLTSLLEDQVDMIISTKSVNDKNIECFKIYEEKFIFITGTNALAAKNDNVEIWMAEQKWISYALDLPIIRRFWKEHYSKRPPILPTHIIPDLRAILSAVENNLGVSLLPTYLIHESLEKQKIQTPFSEMTVNNHLFLLYKKSKKEKPAIKEYLELLIRKKNYSNDF